MVIKKFINKILKRKQISIAGISKFDIDQNRLHKYENYNENEIKNHYYNWWNDTAKRNINWVKEGIAHEKYCMDEKIDVWHVGTKLHYFPDLKNLLEKTIGIENLNLNRGADLGCGTVTFFEFLEVKEPVLIDLSKAYCNFMASKGWKVLNENIENLSLESNSQDVVICSDILEHVLSWDKAIKQVSRILSDDGLLLVNLPWQQNLSEIPAEIGGHIRTFDEKNLSEYFAGWQILASSVVEKKVKPNCIPTINLVLKKKLNQEGLDS